MKNKKTKSVLIVSGIIILLFAGGLGYYVYDLWNSQDSLYAQHNPVGQEEAPESINEGDYRTNIGADSSILYILFLGIDKDEQREETMGVFRTDTISVARIDLDNKKVRVLSIPRDTYTYVPVEDKVDKINHAYAYGSLKGDGVGESIKAVNNLLGRQAINHYFLIDMEPVPKIVDEIGGVEVNVDMDMDMSSWGIHISKGLQVLNGQQSVVYLRWRNSPGGDIDRIKHQQTFMLSLLKQQQASGELLESLQIILKYHNDLETDLTFKQMVGLARYMTELPDGSVSYAIIPGHSQMINGISYWVMDKSKTQKVLDEFFS